jgi:hypothetical protein
MYALRESMSRELTRISTFGLSPVISPDFSNIGIGILEFDRRAMAVIVDGIRA